MTEDNAFSRSNPWKGTQDQGFVISVSEVNKLNNLQMQSQQVSINLNGQVRMVSFEQATDSQQLELESTICKDQLPILKSKISLQENVVGHSQQTNSWPKNSRLFEPLQQNIQKYSIDGQILRKPSLYVASNINEKCRTSTNIDGKRTQKQNTQTRKKSPQTQKHVRIISQDCVKYFSEQEIQSTQLEERNPESVDSADKLFTELSQQFQYIGDFSLIRKEVVQLAMSKKLTIMQNTNQFITIKVTSKLDYCQCFIKSCLNLQETGGIYQLKNSIYKRNKAKFILVSGNQKDFLHFFRNILIKLWNSKHLKLKNKQIVEFLVNVQKQHQSFKQLKKEYTTFYNQLNCLNKQNAGISLKLKPHSLLSGIKSNLKRLRSPQKTPKPQPIDIYTKLLQHSKKVNSKFIQLRTKLFQIQGTQSEQQFLETKLQAQFYFHQFPVWKLFGFHHKKDFQLFSQRKQDILKTQALRKIFNYLEMQQQYNLFLFAKKKSKLQCQVASQQVDIKSCQGATVPKPKRLTFAASSIESTAIPYQQCIKQLELIGNLALIPSKFLASLRQFYHQLQSSYTQLYAEKSSAVLSSMDDELPITIFITLFTQFNNEESIALNFIGKIKWILKWIEDQQIQSQPQVNFSQSKLQDFSKDKKILTTLQAAILFIMKEWKEQDSEKLLKGRSD